MNERLQDKDTRRPPRRGMAVIGQTGLTPRAVCQSVRLLTAEYLFVGADRIGFRRERRRIACHIRQIAMYVCHVALRMTMKSIGEGFGRDRSTVAHACAAVEDRRDNRDFDEFVSAVERVALIAFGDRCEAFHD